MRILFSCLSNTAGSGWRNAAALRFHWTRSARVSVCTCTRLWRPTHGSNFNNTNRISVHSRDAFLSFRFNPRRGIIEITRPIEPLFRGFHTQPFDKSNFIFYFRFNGKIMLIRAWFPFVLRVCVRNVSILVRKVVECYLNFLFCSVSRETLIAFFNCPLTVLLRSRRFWGIRFSVLWMFGIFNRLRSL